MYCCRTEWDTNGTGARDCNVSHRNLTSTAVNISPVHTLTFVYYVLVMVVSRHQVGIPHKQVIQPGPFVTRWSRDTCILSSCCTSSIYFTPRSSR
ncbi:unnamed protein product [Allacma fusca]|uniref:Uncharacterized protein n=1 Tax=Allacma fusca TaxID=39272 RepID=A0A8J2NP35_9HEXA|nr:unnamed protein product [Allacma fusca]